MQSLHEIDSVLCKLGPKQGNLLIFMNLQIGMKHWMVSFRRQRFAGNDLRAFLTDKQRIKFSLKVIIIIRHFKLQTIFFHNKISYIIHTYKNLLLGTPDPNLIFIHYPQIMNDG